VQRAGWKVDNINDLFVRAANAMEISEFEVGEADNIRFTYMSSCIGLIAVTDSTMIGVHLLLDVENEWEKGGFTAEDVGTCVASELQGNRPVFLIGNKDVWYTERPSVLEAIEARVHPYDLARGSGVYRAYFATAGEQRDVRITMDGKDIFRRELGT
jgi:hypothetical protein